VPVTSSIAAGGVDAESEKHFLVADTPEAYAAAIKRICSDPVERQRLAEAGRARMLSHHAWPRSMERLDGIIERCVKQFQENKENTNEDQYFWPRLRRRGVTGLPGPGWSRSDRCRYRSDQA
jgi:hypothetical protein